MSPDYDGLYRPEVSSQLRQNIQARNHMVLDQHLPDILEMVASTSDEGYGEIAIPNLLVNSDTVDTSKNWVFYYSGDSSYNGFREIIFGLRGQGNGKRLSEHKVQIAEDETSVRIDGDVTSAYNVEGNGYGSWLLGHNPDFLQSFLLAHGYADTNKTIYSHIRDAAIPANRRLEETVSPSVYGRRGWTTNVLAGRPEYTFNLQTVENYTGSRVGSIFVLQDISRGIRLSGRGSRNIRN